MVTNTDNSSRRLPTTGPVAGDYTRYAHVTSAEGVIIYDLGEENAWIQAAESLALDAWR
jgi:hypothetical protein